MQDTSCLYIVHMKGLKLPEGHIDTLGWFKMFGYWVLWAGILKGIETIRRTISLASFWFSFPKYQHWKILHWFINTVWVQILHWTHTECTCKQQRLLSHQFPLNQLTQMSSVCSNSLWILNDCVSLALYAFTLRFLVYLPLDFDTFALRFLYIYWLSCFAVV